MLSNLRFFRRSFLIWFLLLGLLLTSCTGPSTSPVEHSRRSTSHVHGTKPPQASEAGSLPNSALTPGAILEVTKEDICTTGYTKKVRNVPATVKQRVYANYATEYVRGAYEVDHLIPLELGGSNSVRNLWPEAYDLVWGAHVKDQLENKLHQMVCQGSLPLDTAQNWIAQDWIAAYQHVFHTDRPHARREYREGARRRENQ